MIQLENFLQYLQIFRHIDYQVCLGEVREHDYPIVDNSSEHPCLVLGVTDQFRLLDISDHPTHTFPTKTLPTQTPQLRPLPIQTTLIQTPPDSNHPNLDPSRFRPPQFRPLPIQTSSIQIPPDSDLPNPDPTNSGPPNSDPLTQTPQLRTSQFKPPYA